MTDMTPVPVPEYKLPEPPAPPAPPQAKDLYGRGTLLAIGVVVVIYAGITVWKLLNPAQPPAAPASAAVPAAAPAVAPDGGAAPEWALAPAGGPATSIPWTSAPVVFDGVASYSRVDLGAGSEALLDGLHPASVSLWFKRGGLRGDALFIKGADPFMCLAHFSNPEAQKLYFYFKRGSDAASIRVYADGFTEAGEWVHVAVTYDGSGKAGGVAIYKNGAPQQVVVINDALDGPVPNEGPVVLGAYRSTRNLDWFFSGELQGFTVTDRALSAGEVNALAQTPPSGN